MSAVERTGVWLAVVLTTVSSSAGEEGFTSLFDGKTLKGWTVHSHVFQVSHEPVGALVLAGLLLRRS